MMIKDILGFGEQVQSSKFKVPGSKFKVPCSSQAIIPEILKL